eukprot:scaffold323_cov414-Prasinococcus_capsulatus_cf.AAC.9
MSAAPVQPAPTTGGCAPSLSSARAFERAADARHTRAVAVLPRAHRPPLHGWLSCPGRLPHGGSPPPAAATAPSMRRRRRRRGVASLAACHSQAC